MIVINEARTREAHPHLGGLLVAIQQAPQHETAWARGADGEARVAAALEKHLDSHTVVLHDRSIPGTRANIDHIAIAPSGAWVIDAKRRASLATPESGDGPGTAPGNSLNQPPTAAHI